MQVTTGGSDSTIATGGVVLNMVTKRGTNEWRGSGRYYQADKAWQSKFNVDNSELGKAGAWNGTRQPNGSTQPRFKQGNQIDKSRTTAPSSAARSSRTACGSGAPTADQKIDLLTIADVADKTHELETYNVKLNAQIAANNSATVFVLSSDKMKIGRNAGPTPSAGDHLGPVEVR